MAESVQATAQSGTIDLSPAPPASAALTKRKLTDAITALDEAFRAPLPAPRKKARTTLSTPALASLLPPPPASIAPSPAYLPLSLPALLSRLATYRLTTFSPKPSSLSPLSSALLGWSNVAPPRERLECVSCAAGLVLLPPEGGWKSAGGERLRERYEGLLRSGHEGTCPWRMRGCARSLYRLEGAGRGKLVEELKERTEEMKGWEELRVVQPVEDADLERVREVLGAGRTAAALALCGWTRGGTRADPVMACTMCVRQVYAESFLPSDGAKAFDVLEQHQSFCPYVDAGATARTGWEIRVDTVLQRQRKGSEASAVFLKGQAKKLGTRELLSYVRELLGPKSLGRN